MLTAMGVSLGQAVWAVATSVGVTALLVSSEPVFRALRLVGAAYLVYLGLHALHGAFRPARRRRRATPLPRKAMSAPAALRRGLLSNLGNPKMAVFFTSLLPQFADGESSWSFVALLILGLVFSALTFVWLSAYALAVARAGDWLRRTGVRRALDIATGIVLVAFGARLATER